MHAEASLVTHMNHDMLDHLTPFPTVRLPAVAVTPAIAVPNHVIAVDSPFGSGNMGHDDDLDLHRQVNGKSN